MNALRELAINAPDLPLWALSLLLPGYTAIDGVLSYRPERSGDYMTGEDWPEVNDSSPVPRARASTLAEFRSLFTTLKENSVVLCVCDGGGHPSSILAAEYPHINFLALDLSLDALRFFARRMDAYFRLPTNRIVRLHASAINLPVKDASIEAIIGAAAIHHLQLLHTFFKEAKRVLRSGGKFHFSGERLWSGIEPAFDDESDITRTALQYRRAFETCGLIGEVQIGDGELYSCASRSHLPVAFWRAVRPAIPRVRAMTGRGTSVSVLGRKAGA